MPSTPSFLRHAAPGALALALLLGGVGAAAAAPSDAQAAPAAPAPAPAAADAAPAPTAPANPVAPMKERAADQQVIVPDVDRRVVRVPRIPSNDFELGLFTGTYNTQNFGTSLVGGVRAGYQITEDVFVEAVYGQTKVSDENYRQILPGGIFPVPKETLRYYDLSAGYNLFPGEIFLAHNHAKVSTLYLVAGLGSTKFDNTSHETINVGTGMRIFLADWAAVQLDVRDHVFTLNLLGRNQTTQNLELGLGATFFF
jgi:outer membrane beta-barrel protein